jgi:DNA-binding response OmpR family regulator
MSTHPPSGPRRLLIIDDEESLLRPLARYFTNLGWRVTTAREAEEAEALIEHRGFDLVILDLELSRFGRGGLEVLAGVRERKGKLPVIVLSAFVAPGVEAEAYRLGASGVIHKPCPLPELAQLADAITGRRS